MTDAEQAAADSRRAFERDAEIDALTAREARVEPVERSSSEPPRSNKNAPESSSAAPVEAVEVLRELVRLKELKEEAMATLLVPNADHPIVSGARANMLAEYERCKPAAWDRARTLVAQPPQAVQEDERDAKRFAWYFSDKPKGEWLMTYLSGMKAGWTTDQWRAAIDAAMAATTEPKH